MHRFIHALYFVFDLTYLISFLMCVSVNASPLSVEIFALSVQTCSLYSYDLCTYCFFTVVVFHYYIVSIKEKKK